MLKISAIILNWNQAELTKATIDSLQKINQNRFTLKIYLVDNFSRPEIQADLKKYCQKRQLVEYIQTGSNLGYAGGNNYGIKVALKNKTDYVLIANNDLIFHSDFLEKLLDQLMADPRIGIAGPKIYFAPGYEFHRNRYQKKDQGRVIWSAGGQMDWKNILGSNIGVDQVDKGQYDRPTQPDFISGCCFLSPASLFSKVGLFNQDYFMYLEDVEFSQRVKISGYKILYVPASNIWHVNSGSSSSGSKLHDYFITRNRLLFGLKYASPRTKFALVRESFRFLLTGRSPQKQAVVDYYLRNLGKGTWIQN